MIHFSDFEKYVSHFINCDFYCFDTETCCTNINVYNDYYIKKEKCKIHGRHAKVYAWALSNTNNDYVVYGETLEEFIIILNTLFNYLLDEPGKSSEKRVKQLKKNDKICIGVHNLKFDIEFLKYTLFDLNFKYCNSVIIDGKIIGKSEPDKCFNIVENDGIVYGANIYLNQYEYKTRKSIHYIVPQIEFFDTFKIMSQPLESIAKKVIKVDEMFYKMGEEYDYNSVRENGHILTQLEKNYLYNDVYILKEFLRQFYMPIGTSSKTASGIAFKEFLKYTWENPNYTFDKVFPSIYDNPAITKIVKKSYKGGWTFTDKHYLGKHLKNINGTSIDINSSYPSQMYYKPLPYGKPKLFKGFRAISKNQLAIYTIEFDTFYNKDKNDYFGFLQAGEVNLVEYGYSSTDYVYTNIINNKPVGFSLNATHRRFRKYIWNFELDNILKNTVLTNFIILETLVFKSKIGIFNKAIDHFMKMKIEGKKTGNNALTQYAKLCLNSFYGKMASSIERFERTIILRDGLAVFEKTSIHYETSMKYYPPFASAVTAWGRCTLRDALYKLCINDDGSFSPNVLYCDTDSIYSLLPVEEVKLRMNESLHPTQLGKWDIEKQYSEFKGIGSKKYMLTTNDGDLVCKCAGLPKEAREIVTYNTFYLGASFRGKLANKKVPGGTLLVPIDFKLKVTGFNI